MKNRRHTTIVVFLLLSFIAVSQEMVTYPLQEGLKEISGLEQLNESTLVALNDGGNKPKLYLTSLEGNPIKSVWIANATNNDWEDLARDENHLYIGDIGNNQNQRKDLCIYKVRISDVLMKDTVFAERIEYHYVDQKEFPPKKEELNFDAEGMIAYANSLYVFSKNRTEPFNGLCTVYKIPKLPGVHTAKVHTDFIVGDDGWWKDAITAVDVFEDEVYLLTYNRFFRLNFADLNTKPTFEFIFERTTQKEAIVVLNRNELFIADEKQKIVGGGNLYKWEK